MVTGVGDVDESFTIQCNRFRMIQLTIIISLLTPRDKMNAGGGEPLNAMIERIGNIDIAITICGYPARIARIHRTGRSSI